MVTVNWVDVAAVGVTFTGVPVGSKMTVSFAGVLLKPVPLIVIVWPTFPVLGGLNPVIVGSGLASGAVMVVALFATPAGAVTTTGTLSVTPAVVGAFAIPVGTTTKSLTVLLPAEGAAVATPPMVTLLLVFKGSKC